MTDNLLLESLYKKDKRSIARLISLIESEKDQSLEYLKAIHNRIGHAYRIGITGPPGAGKSTIINLLSRFYEINSGEI